MHISEKFLRRSPEIEDLLSGAGWVIDLVCLDVPHDTDGRHHQLHTSRRTLHRLHNSDVCRLGGCGEGGVCVVRVWERGVCVVRVWGGGCGEGVGGGVCVVRVWEGGVW